MLVYYPRYCEPFCSTRCLSTHPPCPLRVHAYEMLFALMCACAVCETQANTVDSAKVVGKGRHSGLYSSTDKRDRERLSECEIERQTSPEPDREENRGKDVRFYVFLCAFDSKLNNGRPKLVDSWHASNPTVFKVLARPAERSAPRTDPTTPHSRRRRVRKESEPRLKRKMKRENQGKCRD